MLWLRRSRARETMRRSWRQRRATRSLLGAVERSNRSVERQIRCMRIALEKSADKAFGIKDSILVWLSRHLGWLRLTSYQRLSGKPSSGEGRPSERVGAAAGDASTSARPLPASAPETTTAPATHSPPPDAPMNIAEPAAEQGRDLAVHMAERQPKRR